jgi:hypothetical protein
MSVKAKAGKGRKAVFSDEVIELFQRLDATPPRRRKGDEFRAEEKALHK